MHVPTNMFNSPVRDSLAHMHPNTHTNMHTNIQAHKHTQFIHIQIWYIAIIIQTDIN